MRIIRWIKALFKSNSIDWIDGNPPSSWPRSWIEEGMRVDPNDPKKVITCWRKSAKYYEDLI